MKRERGFLSSVRLQTKIQLSFSLIGLLTISVTGWMAFENARSAIESITFDRLTSIRETKRRQIESYFQQIRNQTATLAEDRMIIDAMKQFKSSFPAGSDDSRRNELIRPLQRPDSSPVPLQPGQYFEYYSKYHPILQSYLQRFGYEDIILVDAASGVTVYSVKMKSHFGTNLFTGPLRNTNLARAFRDARQAPHPGFVKLVDFAPYPASDSVPASFIASPIFNGNDNIGVLIFQMSVDVINGVMTSNNHWQQEGLGETGETYIVGGDFKMRTDSRFFIQEPEVYFLRLAKTGTDTSIISQIKRRSTSILLGEVRNEATANALKGITDTKIINDYRGIPVLSSFTPLAIPGVQWVMLSEIDASEAFDSVFRLRERLIMFGIFIMLLAASLGVIIARTISRPILSLAKAAEQFGKGDLAYRAAAISHDEIGHLAATFNRMAETLMEHTVQLQGENSERRRAEEEVRISHQRLRNLSAHLQSAREEERKSFAREIHDELGQALTTLKLNVILLREQADPANAQAQNKISTMLEIIDTTIKSVKRMITALRPRLLDDLGLIAAMEWQTGEFQERTGIPCKLNIFPDEISVDPERSTAIFRILQETLTNIARHANAQTASVKLTRSSGELVLAVHDDGKGITEEEANDPKSFGLIGIRERAAYWGGETEITGSGGNGTTLSVRFPIRKDELS